MTHARLARRTRTDLLLSTMRPAATMLLAVLVTFGVSTALAGEWPTYRHDVARSGISTDRVETPLVECWTFQSRHAPAPAWGDPKPVEIEGYLELRRRHFDDVFHAVSDGAFVYFGSSADGKVYCLDAATGRIRWTRVTGGPVRLAPTLADGRVFVGSDDGYAYCLDGKDGSIRWKFRAAPEDRRVLGHGKMISLWPLRTGVLVDEGVAYFAAGVFPAEGVFLYALDASTGKLRWQNGTGGENPQSKISPQGYLLASKSNLYAPMGRVSPAVFDRESGSFKQSTYFGKSFGGTYALLADEHVYTGTEKMIAYHGDSRDRFAVFDGRKLVVAEQTAYVSTETELSAFNRKTFPEASRQLDSAKARRASLERSLRTARDQRGQSEAAQKEYERIQAQADQLDTAAQEAQRQFDACTLWKIPCSCHESLILAGNVLVAGGTDEVTAVAADSGKVLWTGKVDGTAKGLAVADGRLFVSTDSGTIHAFGSEGSPRHGAISEPIVQAPFADSPQSPLFEQAAKTILQQTDTRRGHCLVLGCQTGQLALELAKRSEMSIHVVDPDADKVAAARKAIDAAGMLGARISVQQWPNGKIPYGDYFANLIVSETAMATGELPDAADAARLLKPCGGTLLVGPVQATTLRDWLKKLEKNLKIDTGQIIQADGTWAKLVRGPLPDAGNWTHQYANAANTACGDDRAVKAPLGVLWFGDPGPGQMVNRHRRASGPLSLDGRLFIQGENVVMAYDIYNGLKLWERDIPGAMRTNASHDGTNVVVSRKGLFVAIGDHCLRLDLATGKTLDTYHMPEAPEGASARWGYVATDGDRLFGTRGAAAINSECLFAIEVSSGKLLWKYEGKKIANNAMTIGDGQIFLIDTDVTPEQRQAVIDRKRAKIKDLPEKERAQAERDLASPDIRLVVALDTQTGQPRWKRAVDLTHCGGGTLAAMHAEGVLAVFGVYLDGHYWGQFFSGEFDARRLTAISDKNGEVLWSRPVGYRVRPLIIGDTLHAEPWAFDLQTGEPRTREHPVSGQTGLWQFARSGHHCGLPVASPNCLFFRSYCLGYYDLLTDSGTMHFGAQRPGCWVNFLPTGGLLLAPESSVGCMCPFPNMCTVVFQPTDQGKGFTQYSAEGDFFPVRRLAINLGAPGDRADAGGDLWLGYPRPFLGRLVLDFKLDTEMYSGFKLGGEGNQRNSSYTPIAGTDKPWLFASAARGLKKCEIPLQGKPDGTSLYRVRLLLTDPDNAQPGRRVFDVKLQGRVVQKDLDIAAESGGRDHALVKEFGGIQVDDRLTVELVAKNPNPSPKEAPILHGIEVVREKVIGLGCVVPDFLLSSIEPKRSDTLELANLRDSDFNGTIRVDAPKGFDVTLGQSKIKLAAGTRASVPLEIVVNQNVPAGDYSLDVSLVRADGTVEKKQTAALEHLGKRGRIVVEATEDTVVMQRYPEMNKGTAAKIMVDGGSRTMGDLDHSLIYLKFAVDIPGKSQSVLLRIQNAGNPSRDAGHVCVVDGDWTENKLTYGTRPKVGRELVRLGNVASNQMLELPLKLDLSGKTEVNLAIDPTSCDGIDFLSRESAQPPELVIEYTPNP